MSTLGGEKLGGGFNGISVKQTLLNHKDGEQSALRKVLRSSWNTKQAAKKIGNHERKITPFRAINNSGDYLNRQNYFCGGSNPTHLHKGGIRHRFGSMISNCDTTGIEAAHCNVKFVPDSSDYTKFKKQTAINNNYNDNSNGGYNNSAYSAMMRIRR